MINDIVASFHGENFIREKRQKRWLVADFGELRYDEKVKTTIFSGLGFALSSPFTTVNDDKNRLNWADPSSNSNKCFAQCKSDVWQSM